MTASWQGRLAVVKTLLTDGADMDVRDNNEYSALEHAARNGRVDILLAMIEHGADVKESS